MPLTMVEVSADSDVDDDDETDDEEEEEEDQKRTRQGPFLASDGVYYDTYTQVREANIRHNNARLKALGLLESHRLRQPRQRPSANSRTNAHKLTATTTNINMDGGMRESSSPVGTVVSLDSITNKNEEDDDDTKNIEGLASATARKDIFNQRVQSKRQVLSPPVTRRSMRHRGKKGGESSVTQKPGAAKRLAMASDRTEDMDEEERPAKIRRRQATPKSGTTLTEADKARLAELGDWGSLFEEYLQNQSLSQANFRSVMRQVTRLREGVGIGYSQWKEGVLFRPGRPVELASDLEELYQEAQDFEEQHGRDLGNGWLLRHPIKKLIYFQQHCLQQPQS